MGTLAKNGLKKRIMKDYNFTYSEADLGLLHIQGGVLCDIVNDNSSQRVPSWMLQ